MGTGKSGLYGNTKMNSTYLNSNSKHESYSDRGIDIPEKVKDYLSRLVNTGDYIKGKIGDFSMTDVSIMSKETGVEFAKITIENKTYLIKGDKNGTVIPDSLLTKMRREGGTLDFHSHPHNDDCIPSISDMRIMAKLKKYTKQKTSYIVTPNGRTTLFSKDGVIQTGIVSNRIDADKKKALRELFGGK